MINSSGSSHDAPPAARRRAVAIAAALVLLPASGVHAAALHRPGRSAGACDSARAGLELGHHAAVAWLDRATAAVGMPADGKWVLHYQVSIARELADQSDRPYPPFIQLFRKEEHWFDPSTGVERGPGANGGGEFVSGAGESFDVSKGAPVAAPRANPGLTFARAFDPWNVLVAWKHDSTVRVAGECPYLDYDRVVLTRRGALGEERLYLDPVSAIPMKLEQTELHYFLGPVHARYLYSAWDDITPYESRAYYPVSVIEQTDGLGQETHTVYPGEGVLAPRDSAPALALPAGAAPMPLVPAPPFGDEPTDTVRVGPHAFLLVNRRFTSAIALAADTVYLFDEPAGEVRARHDSTWIARLFPGRHPVELVLPSAVWPHIAGVRYWVAMGARVVGPRLAEPLVRGAVARSWKEHPDELERLRERGRHVALHYTAVSGTRALAGGAVRMYELHGDASEGDLMAYLPADRFLWASDRIQYVKRPSLYVSELLSDVKRYGLTPQWTSGPHFRVIPWSTIASLEDPSLSD